MNIITGRVSLNSPAMALFGDIDKLYDLARDKNPAARHELSNSIGSILESDISVQQAESVADVLIALLRQAEKDLRCALSEKLAALDNAPLRLVLQLANDEIEVAKPILSHSTVLSEYDLLYIIKSKPAAYWQAIAERSDLSGQVIDVLSNTGDFETALNLSDNNAIQLTQKAMGIIAQLAEKSDVLAVSLLRREEMPKTLALHLYQYVGDELKGLISDNYELDLETVSNAIDETIVEYKLDATPSDLIPEDYMVKAAHNFNDGGLLNVKLMLATLRRDHLRSFIAQFSVYIQEPSEAVIQMLSQANGEKLSIAACKHNISKQDFISIYMLSSKIWNYGRIIDISDIKVAVEYYNRASL